MPNTQNLENHAKYVPGYHRVLTLVALAAIIGSIVNFVMSFTRGGLFVASLLVALAVAAGQLTWYVRVFALRAQDRAIRAEENLRCFARTGRLLDERLTMRQIVGLRFASDAEFDELAARAASEGLSEQAIKEAIRDWRADTYRV